MSDVIEYFRKYIHIPTPSCEESELKPSSECQKVLAQVLCDDMAALGMVGVKNQGDGYVYGRIPANCEGQPCIGLIAHLDVVDNEPCEPMNERIVRFDGSAIDVGNGVVLDKAVYPAMNEWVGCDVIVTDGKTILGADDKAGVAEIMAACKYLIAHPEIKHGEISVAFTPDEEIGGGADDLDLNFFGADFAYTLDGGKLGEVEYENFNASSAKLSFTGLSIHPGSSKNRMKNAALMAAEFVSLLPQAEIPAHTEGYEGFYHLTGMQGCVENAELHYILRDHDEQKLLAKQDFMRTCADFINTKYGAGSCELVIKESYRNMRQVLEPHMHIVERADKAFTDCGVTPEHRPIRGGTDGARLSFRGLPCPNLSTGSINHHGRAECACVQHMERMVEVVTRLVTAR